MSNFKKQSQSGFIPLFIIIIIVASLAGIAIYTMQKNNQEIKTQTDANTQTETGGQTSVGAETLNPKPVINKTPTPTQTQFNNVTGDDESGGGDE